MGLENDKIGRLRENLGKSSMSPDKSTYPNEPSDLDKSLYPNEPSDLDKRFVSQ